MLDNFNFLDYTCYIIPTPPEPLDPCEDTMLTLPARCPFCGDALVITELYCRQCDVTTRGRFAPGPVAEFDEAQLPVLRRFARLSPEQLQLLEAFVRCEGRLNRLQEEVGLSYPTLRSRLHEMLETLGYLPTETEKTRAQERRRILDDLAAGAITAAEAAELLRATRS